MKLHFGIGTVNSLNKREIHHFSKFLIKVKQRDSFHYRQQYKMCLNFGISHIRGDWCSSEATDVHIWEHPKWIRCNQNSEYIQHQTEIWKIVAVIFVRFNNVDKCIHGNSGFLSLSTHSFSCFYFSNFNITVQRRQCLFFSSTFFHVHIDWEMNEIQCCWNGLVLQKNQENIPNVRTN